MGWLWPPLILVAALLPVRGERGQELPAARQGGDEATVVGGTQVPREVEPTAESRPVAHGGKSLGVIEGVAWLAKAVDSFGGSEVITANTSHWYRGSTRSLTPDGEVSGTVEVYYAEPDRLRIDSTTGDLHVVQVLNGERGWILFKGEVRPATPRSVEEFRRAMGLQYDRFALRYRDRGYRVTGCREELEGMRRVIRVDLEDETGHAVGVGLYPDTGLVRYLEYETIGSFPFDRVVQRTIYEEYRSVGKTKAAYRITTYHGRVPRTVTTVDTLVQNAAIDESLFDRPR